MPDDVLSLFDDYAVRHARGEEPDVRAYLDRAGAGRGELADLLDRFLASAPPREPDEELVESFRAWARGDPPLLDLRVRRGVTRDAVVEAIVRRFRLPQARRAKVGRYVHRVETGILDAAPVDEGVWAAWAEALRTRVDDLLAWRPPPIPSRFADASAPLSAPARYLRTAEAVAGQLDLPRADGPDEWDEVDELFAGRNLT